MTGAAVNPGVLASTTARTLGAELAVAAGQILSAPVIAAGALFYSSKVGEGSDMQGRGNKPIIKPKPQIGDKTPAQTIKTPDSPKEIGAASNGIKPPLAAKPVFERASLDAHRQKLLRQTTAQAGVTPLASPVAGPFKQALTALDKAAAALQDAACLDNPLCVAKHLLGAEGIGSTETVPVADDLTGGKLENPLPIPDNKNVLISPDQRGEQGASHTGNVDGKPDTGGDATVTPIPAGPSRDDLIYLSNGKDNRLPIPEPIAANNGFIIESNAKHTPGAQGSRPNAGVEPRNSLDLFEHSIATRDPKIRLSIDNDGNIHRFFNTSKDGKGNFHWSGSSGDEKNALGNRELGNFNKEIRALEARK
ncbi:hypothetical protein ABK905_26615 [Acerihabitans sp. KWT182]|uniref:Novel toxin 21 domain-containing protein n=1 Tax=Acerihabitans sp. KWT182 TaxID=3157919 RepID=A0AAU7Q9R3_9GAMM